MICLMLLLTNKCIANRYFNYIDDASVGWREEIECWNWIFKPNLDDLWYVIECVVSVFSMFYNRIDMKYLVGRFVLMSAE